ncbi:E3 ubiquitin-protein ligase rad18 [Perkinsus olseni]|uniref:RING-type E3 ubiquitin transferase n=2 Tax=Perkinsus olseni TaxID=32597 RepID=A0A7J6T2Z2_PEROL|nr:E3 ubiquitin-protein ligase rad18 [Perkinsus olseni]
MPLSVVMTASGPSGWRSHSESSDVVDLCSESNSPSHLEASPGAEHMTSLGPRRSARLGERKVEENHSASARSATTPQRQHGLRPRAAKTASTPDQQRTVVNTSPLKLGRATPPRERRSVEGDSTAAKGSGNAGLLTAFKEMETQLRCPVCKGFLDAPMMAKCSHVFCSACIRRHLELVSQTCPECNASTSVSSLVKEPRIAAMVRLMGENNTRKRIRKAIRVANTAEVEAVAEGKNPVFMRQKLSQSKGVPIDSRPTLPIFRGKKERDIQEMLRREGLAVPYPWSRDAAIREIKEYYFRLQAAYDGKKMGALSQDPTRQGVLKAMLAEKGRGNKPRAALVAGGSSEGSENLQAVFEEARWKMLRLLQRAVKKAREKGSLKRKWVDEWDSSSVERDHEEADAAAKRIRIAEPTIPTFPIFGMSQRRPPDI